MADPLAVIFAAGFGETARRDEGYVPKIMLPVGGKPLLQHQLEWLRATGFDTVVVSLGFKAELVRARFGDGSDMGMRLRYQVEGKPLGNAGSLKALGAASLPEDILVLSGELYVDIDGRRLMEFHQSHQALATIVVRQAKYANDGYAAMGPSRRITEFVASQRLAKRPVAPTELWIVRRKLLHYVPDGRASDFLKDVFPAALKAGESICAYPENGPMRDLRTPDQYEKFAKEWAKTRG